MNDARFDDVLLGKASVEVAELFSIAEFFVRFRCSSWLFFRCNRCMDTVLRYMYVALFADAPVHDH